MLLNRVASISALCALPVITARLTTGKLNLTWPVAEGWVLERVTTLGGAFASFAYNAQTNTANSILTVELPLPETSAFFRLHKP